MTPNDPRDVVICAGVDDYGYWRPHPPTHPYKIFADLHGAVRDCHRFACWTRRKWNAEPELFRDGEASANPIQTYFVHEAIPMRELSGEPVRNAVFVFAGHGELIATRRPRSLAVDYDIGLHCHQSEGLGSDNDRLELTRVASWLSALKAQRYLIVVDACLECADPSPRDPDVVSGVLEHVLDKSFDHPADWSVLLACREGGKTIEDADNKRGLLIGALLDAWNANAGEPWPRVFARLQTGMLQRFEAIRSKDPELYAGYTPEPKLFPRYRMTGAT